MKLLTEEVKQYLLYSDPFFGMENAYVMNHLIDPFDEYNLNYS